jgi:hypothetical protein
LTVDRYEWSVSRSVRYTLGERISRWLGLKCNNNDNKRECQTLVRGEDNLSNNNDNNDNNNNLGTGYKMKFGVPLTKNSQRINRETEMKSMKMLLQKKNAGDFRIHFRQTRHEAYLLYNLNQYLYFFAQELCYLKPSIIIKY